MHNGIDIDQYVEAEIHAAQRADGVGETPSLRTLTVAVGSTCDPAGDVSMPALANHFSSKYRR